MEELERLRAREESLLRQLKMAQSNNEERNRQLDALHFVWCDGGCSSGVHRYTDSGPLTEEVVASAERNTRRMRTWLINHRFRKLTYRQKMAYFARRKWNPIYQAWRLLGSSMGWRL